MNYRKLIRDFLLTSLAILILDSFPYPPSAQAAPAYYDDPFYEQKGTDRVPTTFQQAAESVNPFTGNVNLTHTDVSLPGNGGLDLKVIRAYNGRIYGAKDPYSGQAPLVAATERSVLGIGWSFHFGRVRNPAGKVYSAWYSEPPIIEMPDGASHPVYVDKNNSNQRVSKEFWIYRRNTANTGYDLVLTDGTVYTFSDSNDYKTAYTTDETILPVSAITTPDGNTTTFTYTQYNPNDPTNEISADVSSSFPKLYFGSSYGSFLGYDYADNERFVLNSRYAGSHYEFQINGNEKVRIDNRGYVGIGTTNPGASLHVAGDVIVDGNITAKYQDVAEWVPATLPAPTGTVVILDLEHSNGVTPSINAYDTKVAGVVSNTPGILLGESGEGKVKVATTGRVKVKVDASHLPIRVGDLLVTGDKEGMAMRSEPLDFGGTPIHRPGTILGKALEPLSEGMGEILVLLTLQ